MSTTLSVSGHYDLQKILCDNNLPYIYHILTIGDGACWFNAIVDIFKIETFLNFLDDNVRRAIINPLILRHRLIDFIVNFDINDVRFLNLKEAQISTLLLNDQNNQSPNVLWNNFLTKMRHPQEWASDIILQMTSWFLNVNIRMVSLAPNRRYEYLLTSRNETNNEIVIGYSNNHFQSLIPLRYIDQFKICLGCNKVFKNLALHVTKGRKCQPYFCYPNFIKSYIGRDKSKRKEQDKERYEKKKSLRKEQAKNYYMENKTIISQKRKSITVPKQRHKVCKMFHVSDPIFKSFLIDLECDVPKVKLINFKRQNLSPMQAIMAFRLENLYGAKFPCICCHKIKFANGVKLFAPNKFDKILIEKFILLKYFEDVSFQANGSLWICFTCEDYIMQNKMPPTAAANCLDSVVPPNDLQLSEIENAILAPLLGFMKIIKLPNSRMPALRDRIVNIPIPLSTINKNFESLPRTLDEAKIIPVAIKRKRSYLHNYIQQFINPSKILRAINLLKQHYPPYAEMKIDFKKLAFLSNCSFDDKCEEELVQPENRDLNVEDEICQEEDSITKFQSAVNSDVLLLPDNLEEQVNLNTNLNLNVNQSNTTDNLIFSPGEGGNPANLLSIQNPFVLQFPGLFFNGNNGLHDNNRRTPISVHQFILQRILNVNRMFSENKSFLFAGLFHVELSQLISKINLAYLHGCQKQTEDGRKFFKVEDSFQIFNGIPGSLRYLRTFRYENIARIEQEGPPTIFYTFSCPNLRWAEILATVVPKKFKYHSVLHNLEESKVNIKDFLKDIPHEYDSSSHYYRDEDEMGFLQDDVTLADCVFDCCEEENYFVHHPLNKCCMPINICQTCELHESCHRISLAIFLDHLPNNLTRSKLHSEFLLDTVKIFDHKMKSFRKFVLCNQKLPFKIRIYCDRVEFQLRGFPHIHGLGWGDKEEIEKQFHGFSTSMQKLSLFQSLTIQDLQILIKYADSIITSSTSIEVIKNFGLDETSAISVREKVLVCNVHNHTKTCQSHGKYCRFRFPRFPSRVTLVRQKMTSDIRRHYCIVSFIRNFLPLVKKILSKMTHNELNYCQFDSFLKKVFAQIYFTEEKHAIFVELTSNVKFNLPCHVIERILPFLPYSERQFHILSSENLLMNSVYHFAISFTKHGSRMLHKRDLCDVYINNYNPFFTLAWNGNHDCQFILDHYAVLGYITNYISKAEHLASKALLEYYDQIKGENYELKKIMYKLAQKYLMSRTISEAEAYYKIDNCLTYKQSNLKCIFLHAGFPSKQQKFLSKCNSDEEKLQGFLVEGHEGLFKESISLYEKYLKRPVSVEYLCFAQFMQFYDYINPKEFVKYKHLIDQIDQERLPKIIMSTDNFAFCMLNNINIFLPQVIKFNSTNQLMRLRKYPCVVRYKKYSPITEAHEFYFSELKKFKPHRSGKDFFEFDFEKCLQLHSEVNCSQKSMENGTFGLNQLNEVKYKIFPNLAVFEEAQQQMKALDLNLCSDKMSDCLDPEEEFHLSDEESEFEGTKGLEPDPEIPDSNFSDNIKPSSFNSITIEDRKELILLAKKLNSSQYTVLQKILNFCSYLKSTKGKTNVSRKCPPKILLEGGAGTGKSFTINTVRKWINYMLYQPGDDINLPYVIVVAPTGMAACQIDGSTIHSTFKFGFGNSYQKLSAKTRDLLTDQFRNVAVIIIDEISMLSADMFFNLSRRLSEIKCTEEFFGGCAVLAVGDILQLKPIDSRFFFECPASTDHQDLFSQYKILDTFETISLQQNHRQESDLTFNSMLNEIRTKNYDQSLSEQTLNLLLSRVIPLEDETNCCRIFARNETCRQENDRQLQKLNSRLYTNLAIFVPNSYSPKIKSGDLIDDTPFVQTLKIKKEARIILKYNLDIADRLVNGSQGTVHEIIAEGNAIKFILINFDDSRAGQFFRKKFFHLPAVKNHSTCVPISKIEFIYRNKNDRTKNVTVIQFPLKLAFSITAHSAQGSTISFPTNLQTDFSDIFEGGMSYVILSRLQRLEQLYLKPFNVRKIFCNAKAKNFYQKLVDTAVNLRPSKWESEKNLKIISLNIRSLNRHLNNLQVLEVIKSTDILCLQETWMYNHECYLNPDFNSILLNDGARGLATFYRNTRTPLDIIKIKTDTANYIIVIFYDCIIVNIYQFSGCSDIFSFKNIISSFFQLNIPIIICGDLNINLLSKEGKLWLNNLENLRQIVLNPTHISGSLLDHIYYVLNKNYKLNLIEQNFIYFSDHTMQCFTLENN